MREFAHDFTPKVALYPAARMASATGGAIDRLGYQALSFLISTGDMTGGVTTVVLEESPDDVTYTPIPATSLTVPVPAPFVQGNAILVVGYTGDARYVRAKSNVAGNPANGTVVGVTVLLGRGNNRPAGTRIA